MGDISTRLEALEGVVHGLQVEVQRLRRITDSCDRCSALTNKPSEDEPPPVVVDWPLVVVDGPPVIMDGPPVVMDGPPVVDRPRPRVECTNCLRSFTSHGFQRHKSYCDQRRSQFTITSTNVCRCVYYKQHRQVYFVSQD